MKRFLYLAITFIMFFSSVSASAQPNKELKSCSCKKTVTYTASTNSSKSIDNLVWNYPNQVKIIFSDIDGTLIPLDKSKSSLEIPNSLIQSIQKLKRAQIPLILVTGRSALAAKEIADKIIDGNTYIIALQGAEIVKPNGETIYKDNINNKNVTQLVKEIIQSKKPCYKGAKVLFFIKGQAYSNENTKFPYFCENIKIFKSFNEFEPNFTASKIVIYQTNTEKFKLIQPQLKKKFPNLNIDMATDCTYDITSKTATKGLAVKNLANILGIDLKNAAVFGDSENDISMFNEVKAGGGLPIAVGNAMDSLKNNAVFITSPAYENGFAKAIDIILKNNALLNGVYK